MIEQMSPAAHRANMAYAKATQNHELYSRSWDALNMPRINAEISRWNTAMREITAKQITEQKQQTRKDAAH